MPQSQALSRSGCSSDARCRHAVQKVSCATSSLSARSPQALYATAQTSDWYRPTRTSNADALPRQTSCQRSESDSEAYPARGVVVIMSPGSYVGEILGRCQPAGLRPKRVAPGRAEVTKNTPG